MITLDFDLAHYLHLGGYARAAGLDRDQDRWRDHVLGLSAARHRGHPRLLDEIHGGPRRRQRRQRRHAAVVREQVVRTLRRGHRKPDLAQTADQQVPLLAIALRDAGEE